jgi:hypothetical protein
MPAVPLAGKGVTGMELTKDESGRLVLRFSEQDEKALARGGMLTLTKDRASLSEPVKIEERSTENGDDVQA